MSSGDILEQAMASADSVVDHVVVPEEVLMLNSSHSSVNNVSVSLSRPQPVTIVLHSMPTVVAPYALQPMSQTSVVSTSTSSSRLSSSSLRPVMSPAVATSRPILPKQVAMVGPINGNSKVIAYNVANVKTLATKESESASSVDSNEVRSEENVGKSELKSKRVKTYFPEDLFPTKSSLINFLEANRKRAASKPRRTSSTQSKLRKQFGLTIEQAKMTQHSIVDDDKEVKEDKEESEPTDEGTEQDIAASKPSITTRSGREVRPVNLEAESLLSNRLTRPKTVIQEEEKPKRKLSVPPQYRCRVCNKIYLGDRKMRRHMKLFPTHGPPPLIVTNTATTPTSTNPSSSSSTLVSSLNIPVIPLARTQLEELVKNLDAELVLDVVAKKMFDNFSMWQLTTKKMSLAKKNNNSSRLARLQQALTELDALLSEVKTMVDNCLTDTKLCDANADSCTMGEYVQAALNTHEGPWYLEHPSHIPQEFQRLLDLHVDVSESSGHPLTNTLLTSSCDDDNSNSLLSNSSDTGLTSKVVLEKNLGVTDSMDVDDNDDEDDNDNEDSKKQTSKNDECEDEDEEDGTVQEVTSKSEISESNEKPKDDNSLASTSSLTTTTEASVIVDASLMSSETTNARLSRSARELALEIDSLGPFPHEDESGDKANPLPSFSTIINKPDEQMNKKAISIPSDLKSDNSHITQSNFKLLHVALEQHTDPKASTSGPHMSSATRVYNLPMSGPPSVVPTSEVARGLDVGDLASRYVSGPPSVDVGHGFSSMSGPPSVQHKGVDMASMGSPMVSMALSETVMAQTTASASVSGSPSVVPKTSDATRVSEVNDLASHYVSSSFENIGLNNGNGFVAISASTTNVPQQRSMVSASVMESSTSVSSMSQECVSTPLIKTNNSSFSSQKVSQAPFSTSSSVHLVEDVPLSPRVEMPLPCLTQVVNNHSSMSQLSAPSSVVSSENHYDDQVNAVVGDLFETNNDFCSAAPSSTSAELPVVVNNIEEEGQLKRSSLHTANLNALLNDLDSVLSEAGEFDHIELDHAKSSESKEDNSKDTDDVNEDKVGNNCNVDNDNINN